MNNCGICSKSFSNKDHLKRHQENQHSEENTLCEICGCTYENKRKLVYHQKRCGDRPTIHISQQPGPSNYYDLPKRMKMNQDDAHQISIDEHTLCSFCKVSVNKKYLSSHLRSNKHKQQILKKYNEEDENIYIINSALKSRIISYRVSDIPNEYISCNEFLFAVKQKIITLINLQIEVLNSVKVNFELFGLFSQPDVKENEIITSLKSFNTKNRVITKSCDLDEIYSETTNVLNTQCEEFQDKESGWALEKVLYIEINFNKYNPLRGSSYMTLPLFIKNKKAVINIQNSDEACFAWSIMSSKYPSVNNSYRCTSYPHYSSELVLDNINFPMPLKDISLFEKLNNISVNVYGIDEECKQIVGPLYYTSSKKEHHVNLLFLEDDGKTHYCWIKNFSALIGSQLSKNTSKKWVCDGCLTFHSTESKLNHHLHYGCNKIKCILPTEENDILEFTHYHHKLEVPFVIYCDFEAILKPIHSCTLNPVTSFTENILKHEPCSFAYYIKCSYNDSKSKFITYRGSDCGKIFINKIKQDLEIIYNELNKNRKMKKLSYTEKLNFNNSTQCHICDGDFNDNDDDDGNYKVMDHCHLTGKFRGAAHSKCNLNYKIANFVPIFCHNLSGYDAHFIIKELGFDTERIDLIAQNKEQYISFTKVFKINEYKKIRLRFVDSFKFMAASLDKLSNNLNDSQFKEVRKSFSNQNEFCLIKKKGVFPYDYIDSFKKFDESQLPSKNHFYNKLINSDISDEQYNHALNVWKTFKCKNLGEYSDLYLKSDVLILADIFENFRNVCMQTYGLDPAHYFTSPGLSWDAMLKFTKIKLELLKDIDMINFIKKGIRGGLAQCSKRYAKANHKYMKNYNKDKDSNFLVYLDANNLYGWAMSQSLPYANFSFLNSLELEEFSINLLTDNNSDIGYILEVDLDYPNHLHKKHNDLPFCMENMKPPYTRSKQNKLIASLESKKKYVIHQTNLIKCLNNGLILTKIHRVLKFSQKPWLKSYIDLNTDLRTKAQNSFEKDFYKLKNNSVFGKTIENVEKRTDVRLLTHWENLGNKFGANTLISKPNFHSSSIFDENLVAIQMNRLSITYNKPIYVGFCVLELSKTLMYDFHYDYIKTKYNDDVTLLYTDTDSLIYEIKTIDFYQDIKPDLNQKFDTSDYSPNNLYNFPLVNKKVLGMFKDECCGKILTEFVGIRAKSYSLNLEDDNEIIKKIKGIKKNIVSDCISFNDFKNCLDKNVIVIRSQINFRSIKHDLYTQLINKVALSNFDDKRFVIPNSYKTLAWGNNEINHFYFN